MLTLYAATSNPGKLREYTEAAAPAGIHIAALPGLASLPPPAEDAATFTGNSDLKARAYSLAARGQLVFADDSGLEVSALGGRPGVLSARFAEVLGYRAGEPLSKDQRNNECVLALLHEAEVAQTGRAARDARFVCSISLARDGTVLLRAEASLEGEMAEAPRGQNGFGYDSLFVLRSRGLTLAELPDAEKWEVSHRGQALRALLQQLSTSPQTEGRASA